VSRSEIHAVSDRELPRYTIFVPLLNEAPVMRQIIRALTAIDYPSDKLEILCTFEEYDLETIFAFRASNPPSHFKEIILPNCNPKSKPKALNIALREATGEFFVIYDAEIIPDPHQLKHAYLAFKKRPDIAVFQTRLEHYNASENALTRLFNMEFASYYDMFLPGLQNLGLPIPFSGHSVHMRASAVRKIGGWDPYNVAEDCDLGIRLFRHGFMAGMIDSISNEEAVSGIWDWIKQRTRWMKGFIQSSVVHLRHPRQFIGEIGGIRNAVAFILLVPGTVFFNLMNFFSWALLLTWLVFHPPFIKTLYPGAILGIAVTTFVAGTVMFVYQSLIAAYRRKNYSFVKYGLLTPLYWMLLSFATMRAVQQFITSPHSWEKTRHGAVHTSSPLRIFLRGLRKELSFKV
jgi:cellulose synthase/poly-beta-1,6-N-acetylglucosamine synthase-like glycosyltransferase